MAKSVRASVSKRNRAKLRSTVFGPVENARTERLSAKLQEIAAQPKVNDLDKSNMSEPGPDVQNRARETKSSLSGEEMDVDRQPRKATVSRSRRIGRVQKGNKRNRSSIVFRSHQSKAKKTLRKK